MAQQIAINRTDLHNARYMHLVCTSRDLGARYEVQSVREVVVLRTPDTLLGAAPNWFSHLNGSPLKSHSGFP